MDIGIIGGGVFGLSSALALRARGHAVTVYDPGPLPHPLAASHDISKAVRLDYGGDAVYTALMEQAIPEWRRWNARYGRVFEETGILVLAGRKMAAFEADSLRTMQRRGHRVEVLDRHAIGARFPGWNAERHAAGYFNPVGGYARASATTAALAKDAVESGVLVKLGEATTVESVAPRHQVVVVAAGAWTPQLLPELAAVLTPNAQTILHFWAPDNRWAQHPTFTADVSNTGWYGFPTNRGGVFKLGHHGAGRVVDPSGPRPPAPGMVERARAFLKTSIPELADAPLAEQRTCIYCDSFDGHFWIDSVRPGVFVAAGGSGHGFKFAPVIGALVADRVEGRANPFLARFAARPLGAAAKEQARARD